MPAIYDTGTEIVLLTEQASAGTPSCSTAQPVEDGTCRREDMRGKDEQKLDVFSYVSPEHRVPKDYALRGLWALGKETPGCDLKQIVGWTLVQVHPTRDIRATERFRATTIPLYDNKRCSRDYNETFTAMLTPGCWRL
jgi:hypothetical protein